MVFFEWRSLSHAVVEKCSENTLDVRVPLDKIVGSVRWNSYCKLLLAYTTGMQCHLPTVLTYKAMILLTFELKKRYHNI